MIEINKWMEGKTHVKEKWKNCIQIENWRLIFIKQNWILLQFCEHARILLHQFPIAEGVKLCEWTSKRVRDREKEREKEFFCFSFCFSFYFIFDQRERKEDEFNKNWIRNICVFIYFGMWVNVCICAFFRIEHKDLQKSQ